MSVPDSNPLHPSPRRFQFGLIDLAEVTAGVGLVAALVAEFEFLGVCLAALGLWVLGMWLFVVHQASPAAARQASFFAATGMLLMCSVGLPVADVRSGPPESSRILSAGRLKSIALALHAYHDRYGQFPPPYIADAAGRPMHSWRVLVLPYLEQWDVYGKYDLNEAWDGPNNSKLASAVAYEFSGRGKSSTPGTTNLFYVTGPGRPGHEGVGLSMDEMADDLGETILLVESDTLAVNWMEPRDLTMEEALRGVNVRPGPSIGSPHFIEEQPGRRYDGANVAMVDGSVRFLPEGVDRDALAALLTIDGGEEFDWNDIQGLPPDYAAVWLPLVGLTYLVLVGWRHLRRSW